MSSLSPSLAVIPARAGSKGLPGKNTMVLAGLPLIAHSIRCAKMSSRIDRLIVSTDGEQIAEVARAHGADVPFIRPRELAEDHVPTMPVIRHAVQAVEEQDGKRYASILLLEPTSPGRLPEDIDLAYELLERHPNADGVVACSVPPFNPFWVGVVVENGYMRPAFSGGEKFGRRQDVPKFLRINGSLYLWRRDFALRPSGNWAEGKLLPLEIPEERALSIDDRHEFEMAKLMLDHGLLKLPWVNQG
jgi:CMP-N,N'-diacetyllegionaminic acid synthase